MRGQPIIVPGVASAQRAAARYYATDKQGREPVPRWAITGYATVFNSPHQHRGRIDVFTADAFNVSLAIDAPFAALIQHSYKNPIAATGVNLELLPDDHGLAFRIEIKGSDKASIAARMVETGQRVGMSVGYVVKASENKTADGVPYRLITRAQLLEISIVEEGAVPQAYAALVDLDQHKTSLREDSRYGFLRRGEHVRDVEARVRRITSALRTLS
jgi:HK97 family phage prohead protease